MSLSELKACLQLKESATSQQLSGALGQEQLLLNNASLQVEVESLRSAVEALEGEKSALQQMVASLEEEKAALPSDKVAVLNSAKLMEEVKFDEEGFVEGQDLTKEEFLQVTSHTLHHEGTFFTGFVAVCSFSSFFTVCVWGGGGCSVSSTAQSPSLHHVFVSTSCVLLGNFSVLLSQMDTLPILNCLGVFTSMHCLRHMGPACFSPSCRGQK